MIYFPTNWGAKEPQNLPNHTVVVVLCEKRMDFCDEQQKNKLCA